ncbi:MAG: nicotinate (nicotinamide) nucleotide adenylyltransferase [Clostridia bacterium]|nr:nicotinate (nicotinamide) nucleotide adenylyltransferase [Clostridia bacterium]
MNIAIFGGSFNPVHNGHINLVKAAKTALKLDKVIIMPTFVTPKKVGRLGITTYARSELCRKAFEGIAEVSDYEMNKGGVSYSYETCEHFKKQYPNDKLYFLMGADSYSTFPDWKLPLRILDCVTLAVCDRGDKENLERADKNFKKKFHFGIGSGVEKFECSRVDVSSTRIRTLAAFGEWVGEYVPENAADYILDNNLYALPDLDKVEDCINNGKRYGHTLRVAIMAAENCTRFGVDEITAVKAAAFHDCAKYLKEGDNKLKGFVCPEGVPAPVVHQYSGAYVAKNYFNIQDENILDAIRFHASGKEDMSPLAKLLYLCDMLEEGRTFDGVERLREIFYEDIDKCLLACLEHQLKYLKKSGEEIYPLTRQAYNFYKEILK